MAKLRRVISGFVLSGCLFFSSSSVVNDVFAAPKPSYEIYAIDNSEPGVLDINIRRPGGIKSSDRRVFHKVIKDLPKYVDDDNTINEVRIHFYSPLDEERDQPEIEYDAATIMLGQGDQFFVILNSTSWLGSSS